MGVGELIFGVAGLAIGVVAMIWGYKTAKDAEKETDRVKAQLTNLGAQVGLNRNPGILKSLFDSLDAALLELSPKAGGTQELRMSNAHRRISAAITLLQDLTH